MCLTVTKREIKIVEEDMTVFKSAFMTFQSNTFMAPFRHSYFSLGNVQEVDTFADEYDSSTTFTDQIPDHVSEIGKGLHSYLTFDSARWEVGNVVVECVIPKGTRYIVGHFGDVVSLALKAVRRLDKI